VTLEDSKKAYVLSCKRLKEIRLADSVAGTVEPNAAPLAFAATRLEQRVGRGSALGDGDLTPEASKDIMLSSWMTLKLPSDTDVAIPDGPMTTPNPLTRMQEPTSGSTNLASAARTNRFPVGTAVVHARHGEGIIVALRSAFRPWVVRFGSGKLHAYSYEAMCKIAVGSSPIPASPFARVFHDATVTGVFEGRGRVLFDSGEVHSYSADSLRPPPSAPGLEFMEGYGFCSTAAAKDQASWKAERSRFAEPRCELLFMDGYGLVQRAKVLGLRSDDAYGEIKTEEFLDVRAKRRSSANANSVRCRRHSGSEGFLAKLGTEIGW
jgi:hypothetical protein